MRLVVVFCFVFAAVVVMGGNPAEKNIREVNEHAAEGIVKSSHKLNKVLELQKKIITDNKYLILKWKEWFAWFDHDKDGKVRFAELEMARNKFIKLHQLKAEQKKSVSKIFTNFWKEYVMWGQPVITEEEFVNFQNEFFQADKDKFLERMRSLEDIISDFMDIDRDGFISEEEYINMCIACGHENEELNRKFFLSSNPVDGKILAKALADDWYIFLTNEDSSKPGVVEKAFEEGGF